MNNNKWLFNTFLFYYIYFIKDKIQIYFYFNF